MSEDLRTAEQLRQLFAQYPQAGQALQRIIGNVDQINALNSRGGGNGEDDASKQYQLAIGQGMPPINETLDLLKVLVLQMGVNGASAMSVFDAAEAEAQEIGHSWQQDPAQ
ncbi:hypothetical protein ACFVS9_31740 [Streptomyces sp. NPDC058008]|uniref:hypothetical protein n=1 Tax=Streptomyces sp. NPDC058008 TaxID=3346303 RepID=UPI0036EF31E1